MFNNQFHSLRTILRFFSTSSQAIIGAGPGGYVSAIRAAQHGLKTACIEKRPTLGGTCLNVGCIPSKALLHNSHLFHQAKHDFKSRGIDFSTPPQLDLKKALEYKDKTVSQLTKGIEFLFKKNKVSWIKGTGTIVDNNTISVKDDAENTTILSAKNIVIATGSVSANLTGIEVDEKTVVSSTGALSLSAVPKKLVVIGSGVIGLELGSVWSRFGSQVTVVEYMDYIGAGMDRSTASAFQKILAKQGMSFKLGAKVTEVKTLANNSVAVKIQSNATNSQEELLCDTVLVAVGRHPCTDQLGLDKRGRIVTDDQLRTSIPNIYAIGDVISGPMLAHKAEEEGIYVADLIAGKAQAHSTSSLVIPSVIYTHPEVAWAGRTEEELKASNQPYQTGTFPFLANSRAKVINDFEGTVKLLASPEGQILGCHIIGPNAGEMIGEAVLAMQNSITVSQIASTCHAHPTLSEAFKEACLILSQPTTKAIHF